MTAFQILLGAFEPVECRSQFEYLSQFCWLAYWVMIRILRCYARRLCSKQSLVEYILIIWKSVLWLGSIHLCYRPRFLSSGTIFRWRTQPLWLGREQLLLEPYFLHNSHRLEPRGIVCIRGRPKSLRWGFPHPSLLLSFLPVLVQQPWATVWASITFALGSGHLSPLAPRAVICFNSSTVVVFSSLLPCCWFLVFIFVTSSAFALWWKYTR